MFGVFLVGVSKKIKVFLVYSEWKLGMFLYNFLVKNS